MKLRPLKWYASLATRKGRRESGCFLIEGPRAVRWLLSHFPDQICEVLAVEGAAFNGEIKPDRFLSESQYRKVSQWKTPQGLAAVVRLPDGIDAASLPKQPGDRILYLEDIQDPGNVGSLIRSAAAFGFSGVIMTAQCADPFSPKCVQASAGSLLQLWYRRHPSAQECIQLLKNQGYGLIVTELSGETVHPTQTGPLILALGNEGDGVSDALLAQAGSRWRLPMSSAVESINVAACGAVAMYLLSDYRKD